MPVHIRIFTQNTEIGDQAEKGETLLAILLRRGISVSAPCGGDGRCGKCRVRASGSLSAVSPFEKRHLRENELRSGIRLACCATVSGEASIWPDVEADAWIEESVIPWSDGFSPVFTREAIPSEAAGANLSVLKHERKRLAYLRQEQLAYGMAVDIGTTTVVAYFLDLISGHLIDTQSGLNAQRAQGADVMTRISACMERPDGLLSLHRAIIGQLNGFIEEFCRKTNASPSDLYGACLAGNTAMLHIAAGIDPAGLAAAPYIPASLFGYRIPGKEMGLFLHPGCDVYLAPCVSAFIGGDITAGMVACELDRQGETCLLIDIGTNGEIVLKARGQFIGCSAAAGPAFEGAHIRCGTGGIAGAIYAVRADGASVAFQTIRNQPPIGICGSGLIDAVGAMLQLAILDETGRILDADEAGSPALREKIIFQDGANAFLLDPGSGICITQKDIREVQLAKSAIASGIATLLHECNLGAADVSRVIVAGGFGSHIPVGSACDIGLFPGEFRGKVFTAGNAAGSGACRMLLARGEDGRAKSLAENCRTIDLSSHAFFRKAFIENMLF